jgi:hypothetical protein
VGSIPTGLTKSFQRVWMRRVAVPLASPQNFGVGNAPPLVRTASLAFGVFILMRSLPAGAPELKLPAVLVGFLAAGTFSALHFARKVPRW